MYFLFNKESWANNISLDLYFMGHLYFEDAEFSG